MNIENFVPSYLGDLRNFCIEDLSGILCRCVLKKLSEPSIDWFAAEYWIDQNKIGTLKKLTEKFLFLTGYQELKNGGFLLPDIKKDSCWFVSSDEVKRVADQMSNLTDEGFLNLIGKLDKKEIRKYQKEFLGRDIWDEFYRPLVKDFYSNEENSYLYKAGYFRIFFG